MVLKNPSPTQSLSLSLNLNTNLLQRENPIGLLSLSLCLLSFTLFRFFFRLSKTSIEDSSTGVVNGGNLKQ